MFYGLGSGLAPLLSFQVEKVRISASCNNVFTIGSWKWGDPETGGFATRKFNVGINVTI